MNRPRSKTRSSMAAAISSSCKTFPHSFSGLFVVKIIGRFARGRPKRLPTEPLATEILLEMQHYSGVAKNCRTAKSLRQRRRDRENATERYFDACGQSKEYPAAGVLGATFPISGLTET